MCEKEVVQHYEHVTFFIILNFTVTNFYFGFYKCQYPYLYLSPTTHLNSIH